MSVIPVLQSYSFCPLHSSVYGTAWGIIGPVLIVLFFKKWIVSASRNLLDSFDVHLESADNTTVPIPCSFHTAFSFVFVYNFSHSV